MRISKWMARVVMVSVVVAGALPLGGCIFFLLGYEMGSGEGHMQGAIEAQRRDDVERWVCAATLSEVAKDRLEAVETLNRAYRSPTAYDPADVRRQADRRLARIIETLDDPDPAVAAAARLLVREMVGETVDLADEDQRVLAEAIRPPPAPNPQTQSGQEAQETPEQRAERERKAEEERRNRATAAAAAYGRASLGALRAYGLARLGDDLKRAVPLLKRGMAFREVDSRAFDGSLPVYCALALHAVSHDAEGVLAALVRGLDVTDSAERDVVTTGFFSASRVSLRDTDAVQTSIAAAIGLGRLGSEATQVLDDLRRREGRADLPLRTALSRARARIAAAGGAECPGAARPVSLPSPR